MIDTLAPPRTTLDPAVGPTVGAHPAGERAPVLIRCQGLDRRYRKGDTEVVALDALDLEVGSGEFLAVMGPSGSGKSTLLNLLAGLDTPTAGAVWVGDTEVSALSQAERTAWRGAHVGFVFQAFNLIPVLTAFENVELPLTLAPLNRRQRRERVATALELVGLTERGDHYPHQLSQGQEQRVGIARAIVTDPTVILADEPTGNLDGASAEEVVELFGVLSERLGKTLVMVTHDPRMARRADRLETLDKGRLATPAAVGRGS